MGGMGLGVMINTLGGNKETVKAHSAAMGKVLKDLALVDNELRLYFEDGTGIRFWDDGQSCCEHRWMHTDDELGDFVGATFQEAELRDGPTEDSEYGEPKESQFLVIRTSVGMFTMVNYNEHNGYYGGFWIVVRPI